MGKCEKSSPNYQSLFFENQTAETEFSVCDFEVSSVRFSEY